MKQAWVVARKELRTYFGSPMALIFVGAFLIVTLFAFFWVETFFVRNIADVRPLFRWMPVLLIFLVAALTMRQWSEEQRAGTLEFLLTLPVRRVELVGADGELGFEEALPPLLLGERFEIAMKVETAEEGHGLRRPGARHEIKAAA